MSTLQDVKANKVELKFKDGSVHELQFTLNALALLEEKYGDVDAAFAQLDKGSFVAIRYMLWAALQHEDSPLTEMEVGKMIDIGSLAEITGALTSAAESGMPTEQQILETAGPVPIRAVEESNDPNL